MFNNFEISAFLIILFAVCVCCKNIGKYATQHNEIHDHEFETEKQEPLIGKFEEQSFNDGSNGNEKLKEANDERFLALGQRIRRRDPPLAPSKPLSDFFYFTLDERNKIRAEHPEYDSAGVFGRELARRWIAAEPHIKQKYEAIANEDKARYEREMLEYEKNVKEIKENKEPKEKKCINYL